MIHLLAIMLWSNRRMLHPPPATSHPSSAADASTAPRGLRVVAIAPTEGATPPAAEPVERAEPEPGDPEPSPPAPHGAEPPAGTDARPPSATDHLTPGLGDRRLWIAPDEATPLPQSDAAAARARISGRVGEIGDSMALAQEATRRMLDWTHTDDEGRRWGVSEDGKLHLGGLLGGLPGGRRPSIEIVGEPEAAERLREWNASRLQAELLDVRAFLAERAKAVRERKERERAKANRGSS